MLMSRWGWEKKGGSKHLRNGLSNGIGWNRFTTQRSFGERGGTQHLHIASKKEPPLLFHPFVQHLFLLHTASSRRRRLISELSSPNSYISGTVPYCTPTSLQQN